MGNPILDMMGTPQQPQSGGIFDVISSIRNSPNPNAAMQQFVMSTPKGQEIMSYIQANGGDAKAAFYNMAAQKGIDPNPILQRLQQFR